MLSDELIGEGSYGAVVKGTYCSTPIAAKSMHPILQRSARFMKQFKNEMYTLQKIRHPNIVTFIGEYKNFIIMECVEGGSLHELVEDLRSGKRTVVFKQKMSILVDISRALEAIHNNSILHRDLSSSNVLLTKGLSAKISDFGVCVPFTSPSYQPSTLSPGCPLYMPLEVLKPGGKFTAKGDMYSFGKIAVELVIEEHPQPRSKKPEEEEERRKQDMLRFHEMAPTDLHDLVSACLNDDPEKRPSAREMNPKLKEILDSLPEEQEERQKPHQETKKKAPLSLFFVNENGAQSSCLCTEQPLLVSQEAEHTAGESTPAGEEAPVGDTVAVEIVLAGKNIAVDDGTHTGENSLVGKSTCAGKSTAAGGSACAEEGTTASESNIAVVEITGESKGTVLGEIGCEREDTTKESERSCVGKATTGDEGTCVEKDTTADESSCAGKDTTVDKTICVMKLTVVGEAACEGKDTAETKSTCKRKDTTICTSACVGEESVLVGNSSVVEEANVAGESPCLRKDQEVCAPGSNPCIGAVRENTHGSVVKKQTCMVKQQYPNGQMDSNSALKETSSVHGKDLASKTEQVDEKGVQCTQPFDPGNDCNSLVLLESTVVTKPPETETSQMVTGISVAVPNVPLDSTIASISRSSHSTLKTTLTESFMTTKYCADAPTTPLCLNPSANPLPSPLSPLHKSVSKKAKLRENTVATTAATAVSQCVAVDEVSKSQDRKHGSETLHCNMTECAILLGRELMPLGSSSSVRTHFCHLQDSFSKASNRASVSLPVADQMAVSSGLSAKFFQSRNFSALSSAASTAVFHFSSLFSHNSPKVLNGACHFPTLYQTLQHAFTCFDVFFQAPVPLHGLVAPRNEPFCSGVSTTTPLKDTPIPRNIALPSQQLPLKMSVFSHGNKVPFPVSVDPENITFNLLTVLHYQKQLIHSLEKPLISMASLLTQFGFLGQPYPLTGQSVVGPYCGILAVSLLLPHSAEHLKATLTSPDNSQFTETTSYKKNWVEVTTSHTRAKLNLCQCIILHAVCRAAAVPRFVKHFSCPVEQQLPVSLQLCVEQELPSLHYNYFLTQELVENTHCSPPTSPCCQTQLTHNTPTSEKETLILILSPIGALTQVLLLTGQSLFGVVGVLPPCGRLTVLFTQTHNTEHLKCALTSPLFTDTTSHERKWVTPVVSTVTHCSHSGEHLKTTLTSSHLSQFTETTSHKKHWVEVTTSHTHAKVNLCQCIILHSVSRAATVPKSAKYFTCTVEQLPASLELCVAQELPTLHTRIFNSLLTQELLENTHCSPPTPQHSWTQLTHSKPGNETTVLFFLPELIHRVLTQFPLLTGQSSFPVVSVLPTCGIQAVLACTAEHLKCALASPDHFQLTNTTSHEKKWVTPVISTVPPCSHSAVCLKTTLSSDHSTTLHDKKWVKVTTSHTCAMLDLYQCIILHAICRAEAVPRSVKHFTGRVLPASLKLCVVKELPLIQSPLTQELVENIHCSLSTAQHCQTQLSHSILTSKKETIMLPELIPFISLTQVLLLAGQSLFCVVDPLPPCGRWAMWLTHSHSTEHLKATPTSPVHSQFTETASQETKWVKVKTPHTHAKLDLCQCMFLQAICRAAAVPRVVKHFIRTVLPASLKLEVLQELTLLHARIFQSLLAQVLMENIHSSLSVVHYCRIKLSPSMPTSNKETLILPPSLELIQVLTQVTLLTGQSLFCVVGVLPPCVIQTVWPLLSEHLKCALDHSQFTETTSHKNWVEVTTSHTCAVLDLCQCIIVCMAASVPRSMKCFNRTVEQKLPSPLQLQVEQELPSLTQELAGSAYSDLLKPQHCHTQLSHTALNSKKETSALPLSLVHVRILIEAFTDQRWFCVVRVLSPCGMLAVLRLPPPHIAELLKGTLTATKFTQALSHRKKYMKVTTPAMLAMLALWQCSTIHTMLRAAEVPRYVKPDDLVPLLASGTGDRASLFTQSLIKTSLLNTRRLQPQQQPQLAKAISVSPQKKPRGVLNARDFYSSTPTFHVFWGSATCNTTNVTVNLAKHHLQALFTLPSFSVPLTMWCVARANSWINQWLCIIITRAELWWKGSQPQLESSHYALLVISSIFSTRTQRSVGVAHRQQVIRHPPLSVTIITIQPNGITLHFQELSLSERDLSRLLMLLHLSRKSPPSLLSHECTVVQLSSHHLTWSEAKSLSFEAKQLPGNQNQLQLQIYTKLPVACTSDWLATRRAPRRPIQQQRRHLAHCCRKRLRKTFPTKLKRCPRPAQSHCSDESYARTAEIKLLHRRGESSKKLSRNLRERRRKFGQCLRVISDNQGVKQASSHKHDQMKVKPNMKPPPFGCTVNKPERAMRPHLNHTKVSQHCFCRWRDKKSRDELPEDLGWRYRKVRSSRGKGGGGGITQRMCVSQWHTHQTEGQGRKWNTRTHQSHYNENSPSSLSNNYHTCSYYLLQILAFKLFSSISSSNRSNRGGCATSNCTMKWRRTLVSGKLCSQPRWSQEAVARAMKLLALNPHPSIRIMANFNSPSGSCHYILRCLFRALAAIVLLESLPTNPTSLSTACLPSQRHRPQHLLLDLNSLFQVVCSPQSGSDSTTTAGGGDISGGSCSSGGGEKDTGQSSGSGGGDHPSPGGGNGGGKDDSGDDGRDRKRDSDNRAGETDDESSEVEEEEKKETEEEDKKERDIEPNITSSRQNWCTERITGRKGQTAELLQPGYLSLPAVLPQPTTAQRKQTLQRKGGSDTVCLQQGQQSQRNRAQTKQGSLPHRPKPTAGNKKQGGDPISAIAPGLCDSRKRAKSQVTNKAEHESVTSSPEPLSTAIDPAGEESQLKTDPLPTAKTPQPPRTAHKSFVHNKDESKKPLIICESNEYPLSTEEVGFSCVSTDFELGSEPASNAEFSYLEHNTELSLTEPKNQPLANTQSTHPEPECHQADNAHPEPECHQADNAHPEPECHPADNAHPEHPAANTKIQSNSSCQGHTAMKSNLYSGHCYTCQHLQLGVQELSTQADVHGTCLSPPLIQETESRSKCDALYSYSDIIVCLGKTYGLPDHYPLPQTYIPVFPLTQTTLDRDKSSSFSSSDSDPEKDTASHDESVNSGSQVSESGITSEGIEGHKNETAVEETTNSGIEGQGNEAVKESSVDNPTLPVTGLQHTSHASNSQLEEAVQANDDVQHSTAPNLTGHQTPQAIEIDNKSKSTAKKSFPPLTCLLTPEQLQQMSPCEERVTLSETPLPNMPSCAGLSHFGTQTMTGFNTIFPMEENPFMVSFSQCSFESISVLTLCVSVLL